MIAYNSTWLSNLFITRQAEEALHNNRITKDELDAISDKYPVLFYTPNLFIRIGLFILTTVIMLFSFGLLALLSINLIEKTFGGLAIFFALLSYAALEYMVQTKRHFQSGADDALLWTSACFLFGGITYVAKGGELANCIIIFIISMYGSLRFADRLMSAVMYFSLLGIFFFACIKMGPAAKSFVPFVVMILSAAIYFAATKTMRSKVKWLYAGCLQIITIAALISFYFAGNYLVVRELSNQLFDLNLAPGQSIPFGWLFWFFTVFIPCLYIARGIQKKDKILIRVGLLLIAAIVCTVRYYHAVLPLEAAMAAGGVMLVMISYGLSRYLKTPKYGFTNLEISSAEAQGKLQIESILLAQTFAAQPAATDGTNFGGGSFGGGGASGEF